MKKGPLVNEDDAALPSAQWRSSHQLAEFIVNVTAAVVVSTAFAHFFVGYWMVFFAQTPSFAQIFRAYLLHQTPNSVACWDSLYFAPPDLVPANLREAVMVCVLHFPSSQEMSSPWLLLSLLAWALGCGVLLFVASKYKSVGWFCWLQVVAICQWVVALYQFARILLSVSAYGLIKFVRVVNSIWKRLCDVLAWCDARNSSNFRTIALRRYMAQAKNFSEWLDTALQVDKLEGKCDWQQEVPENHENCDFLQLQKNVDDLKKALASQNIDELKYVVAAFVKRDKLGIDSPSLHLECNHGTKKIIEEYNALVIEALTMLQQANPELFPQDKKIAFFKHMKQSFGSTALCLSGGGALAMYHAGVIKALLECDCLPNVVSGSSGGSILAAMVACKTNEELLNEIIQEDISTRFIPEFGVRWFPPLLQQIAHCVKTGFLVECSVFEKTTKHYYGEPMDSKDKMMYYTFQDAFLKTGRHVCITVSASDVTGNKGPKKLLLNHVNSPHVLLWSAVAVSCSLPGIMKGKQLMARDYEGNVVPYLSLGKEWIDGSIQHDLPMETMATCFNVTNFIVSQVNPHIVPFIGDHINNPSALHSLSYTLESVITADVRHRLKMLAFLGLFPRIYGQQFNFRQNFVGNVTIIPELIFLESIGIKAILNPTVDDMRRYISGGERATWPKVSYIQHLCCIEKCLDENLEKLLGSNVAPFANWLHPSPQLLTENK